jgi:hypothetical protein
MKRSAFLALALVAGSAAISVAEPVAKSGSFKTQGGFKAIQETMQAGEKHTYSHGVVWGVVSGDSGPLRIATAMCPYINEVIGDVIAFQGKCVWSDTDGDKIFTEWTGKFSASKGTGDGPQSITGGTGKFAGIQGKGPFQGQALNDSQFNCSQQWSYELGTN